MQRVGWQWRILLPLAVFLVAQPGHAADACQRGEKRLNTGEECIPTQLFNYLYCLKNSGGGVIEVKKKTDSDKGKSFEIVLNGKGSGVLLKGEVGGKYASAQSDRVIQEINTKLDPTLAKQCSEIAKPEKAAQVDKCIVLVDNGPCIGDDRDRFKEIYQGRQIEWRTVGPNIEASLVASGFGLDGTATFRFLNDRLVDQEIRARQEYRVDNRYQKLAGSSILEPTSEKSQGRKSAVDSLCAKVRGVKSILIDTFGPSVEGFDERRSSLLDWIKESPTCRENCMFDSSTKTEWRHIFNAAKGIVTEYTATLFDASWDSTPVDSLRHEVQRYSCTITIRARMA